MIIFIRNIPANTLPKELTDFVSAEFKKEPIFSSGLALISEVFALQNKDTQVFEFHGLVHIKSEVKDIYEAAKKLTEKRFKGCVVVLKDYNQGVWDNNEHRNNHNPFFNFSFNKPLADRRRGTF